MTGAQKAWLDSHPDYRPLGQAGGNARWTECGTLRRDGTFAPATSRNPVSSADGAFGVGKLTFGPSGGAALAADDPRLLTTPGVPGLRRAAKRVDPPVEEEAPKDPRGYLDDWQAGGGGLPSQGGIKR